MTYIGQNGRMYRKQLRPGTLPTLPASSAIEKKTNPEGWHSSRRWMFSFFCIHSHRIYVDFYGKMKIYNRPMDSKGKKEEELFDYLRSTVGRKSK